MARGQKDVARGQEEVARGQEQVARGQEQVELEEEVGEVGAVNRAAGGEPGASPTPWTPKPLPAGDERLLEEQVEGEGWGALTIPHLYLSSVSLPFL